MNFQDEDTEHQDIPFSDILRHILKPQATHMEPCLELPCPEALQSCSQADFAGRLQQALYRADRTNHSFVLLLLQVSENHPTSVDLAPVILHRIRSSLRKSDSLLQFAMGSFAILLDNVTDLDAIPFAVEKIIQTLNPSMPGASGHNRLDVRAGVSIFPEDGYLLETLWCSAHTALRQTSVRDKEKVRFASPRRNHYVRERMEMCDALHRGLRKQEFEIEYQPIIEAKTGRTERVELLLRWRSPQRGLLPTERFLHLLEETGLIIPIGEWIIGVACQSAQALRHSGHRGIRFCVNLSERQWLESGFVERLEWLIRDRGHEPDLLEFECPEAVLMRNLKASREITCRLLELGIPVSIDRFGGNNHSLAELMRLPLAGVKIERQLIRRLPFDRTYKAITSGILAFSDGMGIRASASGVENMGQLKFLREQGCQLLQGNLIARPMPFVELEQWLPD